MLTGSIAHCQQVRAAKDAAILRIRLDTKVGRTADEVIDDIASASAPDPDSKVVLFRWAKLSISRGTLRPHT